MPGDLDILFPDRDVRLTTGEVVTVRELGLEEGLRANGFAWPLIVSLANLFDGADVGDVAPHLIDEQFGIHHAIVMRVLGLATDKSAEWLNALNDSDGQALIHELWEVNRDFFISRLLMILEARRLPTETSLPN